MKTQPFKVMAVLSAVLLALTAQAQSNSPSASGKYPINTSQTYPQGIPVAPSDSMASLRASETPNTKAMNRKRERRAKRQDASNSRMDQNARMNANGSVNGYDAGATAPDKPVGKTITDFAASSPSHRMLINALQSADLAEPLRGAGAYTLFAPTDAAFNALPAATQKNMLEGRNRESLKRLLSYHVVTGMYDMDDLTRQIKAGDGKARLQTLAGSTLTAQLGTDNQLVLTDEEGHTVTVAKNGQRQANGFVYSIDKVLMPQNIAQTFH